MRKIHSSFNLFLKLATLIAAIMFTCTFVSAATTQVKVENYDKHPQFKQLNEAYIKYSTKAEKMGKFVTLPLEYFVINYQQMSSTKSTLVMGSKSNNDSIDLYLASCISKLKQNTSISVIKAEQVAIQKALNAEQIAPQGTLNVENVKSAGGYWFYNCPELAKAKNYKKYPKLLKSTVVSGDLVHDDQGGFGITGHSAIVMGHYYSSIYKEYYVRVCEAVSAGVTYGILSDDRMVNRKSSVYRVNGGANSAKRIAAANWVASQRGKKWVYSSSNFKKANITKSRSNWYCSLLVYAAYKAQGVDIGDKGGSGGIMPRALRDSKKTVKVI